MNNGQMELQKDLAEVRAKIKDNDTQKNELLNKEAALKRELETIYALNTPTMSAANLWCRITNALIAKYKTTAEENPEEAVRQLLMLQGALLTGGFLTQEELDRAL